ncbi:MAG: hypothetical protein Q9160_009307 [Pyrenula sp. 1 TL-2023]
MGTNALRHWAPFKIDALGLVTILGAEEMNRKIGRLSISRTTEFLPLVAGQVIADNSFTSSITGFKVYNITDGIYATDVVGWLSRWLLCQKLTYNATTLTIGIIPSMFAAKVKVRQAALIGFSVLAAMILLASIMKDWWGLVNAISLVLSVIARFGILRANREAIDIAAMNASQQSDAIIKSFWRCPDGSCVALHTTRGILTECLLTSPKPPNPEVYTLNRVIAWGAFLAHILSLGMAALPSQLLCVCVLAASTTCTVLKLGSNDGRIGTRLQIRRIDHCHQGQSGPMAATFARLRLSEQEEDSMIEWRIMPMRKHRVWWEKYRHFCAQNSMKAFDDWKKKDTWVHFENRVHGAVQGTAP